MSGTVREILPDSGVVHEVTSPAGRGWLAERYAPRAGRFVRLNMITSLTGSAVGVDETSESLSNRVDRTILGVIRAAADVVLVGARTVRAEGYSVPRNAELAVLTRTGDLDGHAFGAQAVRVRLVCPRDRVDEVTARSGFDADRVIAVDDLSPAAVLDALAARGLTSVACEGGPTVAALFAQAGAIDEYCVTVAPVLSPAAAPFLPVGGPVATEVAGMLVDDAGFSYLRLRARRSVRADGATT
jgi:riboflavin biosynthesis pyrimidine reductase